MLSQKRLAEKRFAKKQKRKNKKYSGPKYSRLEQILAMVPLFEKAGIKIFSQEEQHDQPHQSDDTTTFV